MKGKRNADFWFNFIRVNPLHPPHLRSAAPKLSHYLMLRKSRCFPRILMKKSRTLGFSMKFNKFNRGFQNYM
jgi:hypothetical protein